MKYYEHQTYRRELKFIAEKNDFMERLKGKSVVITGARGLIGSMLVDVIMYANMNYAIGCNVFAILRNRNQAEQRFHTYQSSPFFHIVIADVNKDEIKITGSIDYFIHAASNTHPVFYSTRPIETILTNTVGTNRALQFAIEHNCKKFVFMSSVEIYGENRGDTEKFSEDYCGYIDSNTLRAGYPESKRTGEALCQAYQKEKGLNCVILRISRCYGAGLLQNDSKALTQFLKNGINAEDIVLKSEGKQRFSYVYVADVVDAILFVLDKGGKGEAYNVVGPESDVTLKDLATYIAESVGKKVIMNLPTQQEAEGFSKAAIALMSGDKLKAVGWQGNFTCREGIKRTLHMLKERDSRG